ncbi:restriction endonuclease [Nocardia cyriacigeorgica]|uniref:restriction endonuclease n=1 Tax=Nocardia cyriacigeorgica TaxID=135487 RepID=UPI00189576DE|nr:restriction endonuclease [Nocardia cyriacigeorgica]MBF6095033.1 restriction endonuclease [Nocardia cyriacigeorgica]
MLYIATFEAAEQAAAVKMRALGFHDARITNRGPDGGIDVIASGAVAQVKWHINPVGRPDVQRLYGARGNRHDLGMLFFAAIKYTAGAIAYADEVGIALFVMRYDGELFAQNGAARQLIKAAPRQQPLSLTGIRRFERPQVPAPPAYAPEQHPDARNAIHKYPIAVMVGVVFFTLLGIIASVYEGDITAAVIVAGLLAVGIAVLARRLYVDQSNRWYRRH